MTTRSLVHVIGAPPSVASYIRDSKYAFHARVANAGANLGRTGRLALSRPANEHGHVLEVTPRNGGHLQQALARKAP